MRSPGGLFLALCLLLSSIAFAEDRQAAKAHFAKGSTAFDLGNYDEAVKEYMAAYEAMPDPLLLYNIAQAQRLAGHHREALRFYRTYLARSPDAPNRDEVQGKITELQRLVDQEGHAQTSPPTGVARSPADLAPPRTASVSKPTMPEKPSEPPATSAPRPEPQAETAPPATSAPGSEQPSAAAPPTTAHPGRTLTIAGIVVGAVGVGALIGAAVSSAESKQASDKVVSTANAGGTYDPSVEQNGKTAQSAAIALYAIGGAAAVAGTVLIVMGQRKKSEAAAMVAPTVGPQHAGVFARFTF